MEEGLTEIARQIGQSLTPQLHAALPTTPLEMYNLELDFRRAALVQADLHTARALLAAHLDRDLVKEAVGKARRRYREEGGPFRLRHKGWRALTLTLRGGTRLTLRTPYLRPDLSGRRGPRRSKRRAGGAGVYPMLETLGLTDRITPAAREVVARETLGAAVARPRSTLEEGEGSAAVAGGPHRAHELPRLRRCRAVAGQRGRPPDRVGVPFVG